MSFLKLVILMLLSFVLGALAWRHYERSQSPHTPTAIISIEKSAGKAKPATSTAATPLEAPAPDAAASAEATHRTPPTTSAMPVPAMPASVTAGTLLLPVQGITRQQLQDTFSDARSQGRSHDAIDIMAPAGTPVLAVADGSIEKLFTSERGGLTIYQFEPSGRLAYYYAHLQRYADGLAQGQTVRRGQVIGHVGSTGNANPEAPHLHFAIFVLGPERRWWEGQAINPYPVLQGTASP